VTAPVQLPLTREQVLERLAELPDDAIGRDFARRRQELDAARVALTAARERGEGAGTLRQLAAEVERLEYRG